MNYFSNSNQAFYSAAFFPLELMPSDAVELDENTYRSAMAEINSNKIVTIANGTISTTEKPNIPFAENAWIEAELARSRDELEKAQDSDPSAVGTESEWRTYRVALRAWPQSENFPVETHRPIAPDA